MVTDAERDTGLTTAQAAALAGVSEKSIRNWLKAGQLRPLATTEGRRIDKRELLDFLRERAQATVSHLPPEARPGFAPESAPEAEPALVPSPEAAPSVYVESGRDETAGKLPVNEPRPAPQLTPETINIVLQPLLERLDISEKERRRLHDENVELAGRVGYYQAELAQYKDRILLLEAPKEIAPEASEMPVEPQKPLPWYKRLFA